MTYSECVTYLEIKNLYYREAEKSLCNGIRPISDDVDYVAFIFNAYGTDGIIFFILTTLGMEVRGGLMRNIIKMMVTIHVLMVWKMELTEGMLEWKMMKMLFL